MRTHSESALRADDIASFVRDGFVRIDDAFSSRTAEQARSILWQATGCDPNDRATWIQPVVRLDQFSQAPFREAANAPKLHKGFDQLVGADRWWRRDALGTFPVRFPSQDAPGDDCWHIDVSFGHEHPDFMEWRANMSSKGRALLMLLLFSDVAVDDAPTRIRVGSQIDVARQLAPAGEDGLTLRELVASDFAAPGRGKRLWPQGRLARCICAIRFSCTPHSPIGERHLASWRNLPFCTQANLPGSG